MFDLIKIPSLHLSSYYINKMCGIKRVKTGTSSNKSSYLGWTSEFGASSNLEQFLGQERARVKYSAMYECAKVQETHPFCNEASDMYNPAACTIRLMKERKYNKC